MATRRTLPPLDDDHLRTLALRYVGRYATSRAKLHAYLLRKLKERGWGGDNSPDPEALADRMTELGYVDDAAYATMRGAALSRRGYGPRRVDEALRHAGIADADRAKAHGQADDESWQAAERFARRKRIGPFAPARPDRPQREKMIASFLRAGHDYATARRWVDAAPGAPPVPDEG
ncbi:MAG: RecX family transcriptional regulator [Sphingobium sp.]